jgi:response regulator RpfG family c-di-GMP phosphodiesterase
MVNGVLVTGGSALIRSAIEHDLGAGFSVVHAGNDREALSKLEHTEGLCAVIIDCEQGTEELAVQFLRELNSRAPRIVRVAVAERPGGRLLAESGAAHSVVTKPWNRGDVLTSVTRHLEQSAVVKPSGWVKTHE